MRVFLRILLIFITANMAVSQIDPDNGLPVRQGLHIEWFRSAVTSEDNGVILAWSDTRFGDRDLVCQKLSASGELLWGSAGLLVLRAPGRQEDPVIVSDGTGGVIIGWVDFRSDSSGNIRAGRLNRWGTLLWERNICNAPGKQISIRMADDGFGGAYLSWIDYRNTTDGDLYISHVDSAGAGDSFWGETGITVCNSPGTQGDHTIDRDGTGGAMIAWKDTRNSDDTDVYIQRFTPDGNVHFTDNGLRIADRTATQSSPKLVFEGSYGVILVWKDLVNDNFGDLYAQKIDTTGVFSWGAAGNIVCDEQGAQSNPRIVSDGTGGCFISWEDYRTSSWSSDVYCQRLDSAGDPVWIEDGLVVCNDTRSQGEVRIASDSTGAYIIWMDERNGAFPHIDIFGQYLSPSGDELWEVNGIPVCDTVLYQFSPLFRPVDDGVIALWGDMRSGSIDLYTQKFSVEGSAAFQSNGRMIFKGIDGDIHNPVILWDHNTAQIASYTFWGDDRGGTLGASIYTQKIIGEDSIAWEENGRPITDISEKDQTDHQVAFNGTDFIILWIEEYPAGKRIGAQKMSPEGKMTWGEEGVTIREAIEPTNLRLEKAGGTDVVAAWSDYGPSWYYEIICQRLTEDSLRVWGENGITVSQTGFDIYVEDIAVYRDTTYIVWRSGSWNDQNLYLSSLDENGDVWIESLAVCDTMGNQLNPGVAVDTVSGMVWVIWEDFRSGNSDIYLQAFNTHGEVFLPYQGYALVDTVNDQSNFSFDLAHENETGIVTITWQDFRNGVDYDIYYQQIHYGSDGTLSKVFGENGLRVTEHPTNQSNPFVRWNGPAVWEDLRNGITGDLYYGYPEYGKNVAGSVCTAENKQIEPIILDFTQPGFNGDTDIVIWQDKRSSGKTELINLYFKAIDDGPYVNPATQESQQIPGSFSIAKLYPNPFNSEITLELNIDVPGEFELSVHDILGRLVHREQLSLTSPGIHSVRLGNPGLSGKNLSSGLYFLSVTSGYHTEMQRMIFLK